MNEFLKKVEERKKQSESTSSPTPIRPSNSVLTLISSYNSSSASSSASTNPFLLKKTGSFTALKSPTAPAASPSTSTSASSSSSSSSASKDTQSANPFIRRAATLHSLTANRPVFSQSSASTTSSSATSSITSTSSSFSTNTTSSTPATHSSVSTGSSNSTSSNSGTSTSSVNTQMGAGIYKIKWEQEQKRRLELETQVQNQMKEIQSLRAEISRLSSASSSSTSTSSASSHSAQSRAADRKTKRMTRMQRQTMRMSMHVGKTLDSVLKSIGGLDAHLKAVEAKRIQAEDKLMQIAIAKLEMDELVQKVDTALKKILEQFDKFTNAQIKEMLTKVRQQTCSDTEDSTSPPSPHPRSARFSIILPKDSLNLDVPAPPPLVQQSLSSKPSQGPAPGSLLEQIRKGTSLRNIDVAKLKEEQKRFRAQAKEEMNSMKSLEDVLRTALTSRVLEMNLYDDDEDADEESWD